MSYDVNALVAEVNRRLDDPSRPPMDLRTEPYTAEEARATVARFRTLPEHTQARLLTILEDIAAEPEPERTRAIERLYIALDVVRELPSA